MANTFMVRQCPRSDGQRGFTLLEVLIVAFIIGIVLSVAMLAIGPSEGRALEQEANRIRALMEVAKEEAILNTQEMAFTVTGEGYGFQVLTVEGWQAVEGDRVLRERALPEQVRMQVNIMGEAVTLATAAQNDGEDDANENELATSNRIFFLSSGEMTPFELFLHYETEENGFTIKGNELGDLEFAKHEVTL